MAFSMARARAYAPGNILGDRAPTKVTPCFSTCAMRRPRPAQLLLSEREALQIEASCPPPVPRGCARLASCLFLEGDEMLVASTPSGFQLGESPMTQPRGKRRPSELTLIGESAFCEEAPMACSPQAAEKAPCTFFQTEIDSKDVVVGVDAACAGTGVGVLGDASALASNKSDLRPRPFGILAAG